MIIVGLGCVGLSAAYYCTKMGLRVLGLERFAESGSIGTSSYGHTRIWRLGHPEDVGMHMQIEALEIWKEIEQRTN